MPAAAKLSAGGTGGVAPSLLIQWNVTAPGPLVVMLAVAVKPVPPQPPIFVKVTLVTAKIGADVFVAVAVAATVDVTAFCTLIST